MIPWAVITSISSSSSTMRRHETSSGGEDSEGRDLNLMAMTPTPPRAVVRNSSVEILLPYPPDVTARTYSDPPPPSCFFRTFISATVSPSFSLMDLTPLLVLPVGLNFSASNLVAIPSLDPINTSSPSVHFWHHLNRSPSSSVAIMSPLDVKFSNAFNGVFLIQPPSVASMQYSSSANSDTVSTDVMTSSAFTGNTEGMGTPFAVRVPVGTWNALSPNAMPCCVTMRSVSWSLHVKQ
mmetsp:Transcript_34149/g.69710  ORF Transcript_34149/g.69710 Transcript_34149/m.69710 type:complete len:237 (+) Transcript_34149:190-900(+)